VRGTPSASVGRARGQGTRPGTQYMDASPRATWTMVPSSLPFSLGIKVTTPAKLRFVQLSKFQWLARPSARSLFLLFTYSSRRRLFINHLSLTRFTAGRLAGRSFPRLKANSSGARLAAQEVERNFSDTPRFVVSKPHLM
jgi:hypothetical protein